MADIRNDYSTNCILITEANDKVASGHLFEIAELSSLLYLDGIRTTTLVNADAPAGLKGRIKGDVAEYETDVNIGFQKICEVIKASLAKVVITDLREVTNEWIRSIKDKTGCILICIDEFGHRTLDADILINPMIDPFFWDYGESKAEIYSGHEYLILPDRIRKFHQMKKPINENIENVCISMGGVDYYGTTCKLAQWLITEYKNVHWNIVLGAAFKYKDELFKIIENSKENVSIMQNIDNIYEVFYEADLAFCAGGNTLHELACIGVPTVTIPTMPHEWDNGKRFEKLGFGYCLNLTENITKSELVTCIETMKGIQYRFKCSQNGKCISDGQGGIRVKKIVEDTCTYQLCVEKR